MERWKGLVWALGLAAALAASAVAYAQASVYGSRLLQKYELAPDVLARFVRHDAQLQAKGKKPTAMGGGEDWFAGAMPVPPAGNPYRLVVRVRGTAIADGEAGSLLMTYWEQEGTARGALAGGAVAPKAKAGERLELVAAAGPISFKEDRTLRPGVGYLGAQNMKVDDVRLEVWSGIGKSTLVEKVWTWSPLLVGVVMLGLFCWFRRS